MLAPPAPDDVEPFGGTDASRVTVEVAPPAPDAFRVDGGTAPPSAEGETVCPHEAAKMRAALLATTARDLICTATP